MSTAPRAWAARSGSASTSSPPTRPKWRRSAAPRPSCPDASEAQRALEILLVEDNAINQKLARILLERQAHTVNLAENGREAVEKVCERRYDIVLMDVQMPEMDGVEATRHIRAMNGSAAQVPIIAMTAHAMKGDREKYIAHGMDDYVSKPLDQGALFAAIARHCSGPTRATAGEAPPPAPPEPAEELDAGRTAILASFLDSIEADLDPSPVGPAHTGRS